MQVTLSDRVGRLSLFLAILLFDTADRVVGGCLYQAGWVNCCFLLLLLPAMGCLVLRA